MSTILKSLKKLEKQKEANRYKSSLSGYHGPGALALNGGKKGWFRTPWFKRGMITMVIIGLCLSSLYFYRQSQNSNANQVTLNKQSQDRPQSTTRKPVTKPQPRVPAPNEDRVAGNTVAPRTPPASIQKPEEKPVAPGESPNNRINPRQFRTPPSANTPRAETPVKEQAPDRSNTSAANVKSDDRGTRQPNPTNTSQPTTAQKPAARPTTAGESRGTAVRSPKPEEKRASKPSTGSYDNVSVLRDGRLKVQAIVWSTVSDDRMTVINSRVLHEGESFDGFTLVTIRPDDVIVKEGGTSYKVLFGR